MTAKQALRDQLASELGDGVIAVLNGGNSSEREISLSSGAAVLAALQAENFNAVSIDAKGNLLARLREINPVFVFNALHGGDGENGTIQALLDLENIRYSGSGVLGSALALDKLRAKQLWRGLNLPTPAFQVVDQASDFAGVLDQLGGCVFVKPASEGSSIGMSKVSTTVDLEDAYAKASPLDKTVLVEQCVNGPEYTVAIVGSRVYPSVRIDTQRAFYNFSAKYEDDNTGFMVPSGLAGSEELALQKLAIDAFHALDCSGWGRVDVMRDAQTGEFYLLEVNTVPGLTSHSLVPKAASAAGVSMAELCQQIITASLKAS